MDLSVIYDPPEYVQLYHLPELEALRENHIPTTVLIKAFTGGKKGQQKTVITLAIEELIAKYLKRGITIEFIEYTNDSVRNIHRMNCTELFTELLTSDIHLLPTHLHQGMVTKGGTDSWNMENIIKNIPRLKYHLGSPCGLHLECPVWSQNKGKLYAYLEALDLCLPSITLSIVNKQLSFEDENKLDE